MFQRRKEKVGLQLRGLGSQTWAEPATQMFLQQIRESQTLLLLHATLVPSTPTLLKGKGRHRIHPHQENANKIAFPYFLKRKKIFSFILQSNKQEYRNICLHPMCCDIGENSAGLSSHQNSKIISERETWDEKLLRMSLICTHLKTYQSVFFSFLIAFFSPPSLPVIKLNNRNDTFLKE